MENNLDHLRRQVGSITTYPNKVFPVPEPIPGLAFFPGGSGLWQDDPASDPADIPVGGVMVVGHNFDSYLGYKRSFDKKEENRKGPTWRPLIALLTRANVDLKQCFFTNFFMGLIEEGPSVGAFPGAKDPEFVALCRTLLLEQIRIQKPAYILTLGIHVIPFVATSALELAPWANVKNLMDMDERNVGLVPRVLFREAAHACPVVALTHPCMRHLNIGRRRYNELPGDKAELAMIADAKSPRSRSN